MTITFMKVNAAHKDCILTWLQEPHIKEFWDNSQEHKDDIVVFANGRKEPSPYFNGMFDYWVGLIDEIPYCLIMTHEESEEATLDYFRPYLSKTGRTFGLDFCIGNKQFFGKGLASSTLQAFVEFFVRHIEPKANVFIIDPFVNNPRAIHIYQKAGFQIMREFIQEGAYFDGSKGLVMVKKYD